MCNKGNQILVRINSFIDGIIAVFGLSQNVNFNFALEAHYMNSPKRHFESYIMFKLT